MIGFLSFRLYAFIKGSPELMTYLDRAMREIPNIPME